MIPDWVAAKVTGPRAEHQVRQRLPGPNCPTGRPPQDRDDREPRGRLVLRLHARTFTTVWFGYPNSPSPDDKRARHLRRRRHLPSHRLAPLHGGGDRGRGAASSRGRGPSPTALVYARGHYRLRRRPTLHPPPRRPRPRRPPPNQPPLPRARSTYHLDAGVPAFAFPAASAARAAERPPPGRRPLLGLGAPRPRGRGPRRLLVWLAARASRRTTPAVGAFAVTIQLAPLGGPLLPLDLCWTVLPG